MEFGKTLREAREAKGYSVTQLADMTHIMPQIIEDMEKENFKRIVAPIYGRGFVKLCCQALDLDGPTMLDEFMSLYTGEKPAALSTPLPPPLSNPEPESTPDLEPPTAPMPRNDLFSEPISEPPPARPLSRFAPPMPMDDGDGLLQLLPKIPWRLVALVGVALAVLCILYAGGSALYRSLSDTDSAQSAVLPQDPTGANTPSAAKTPRTPKAVKSLYID